MDKNKKIAALLESLCERPFEGDPQGRPPGMSAMGSRIAQALSDAQAPRSGSASEPAASSRPADEPARLTAELAAILSGTAAVAPCQAFQEAAVTSGAVRLEAQSALAFVEGIEQAPLAAPAHLLEQVSDARGRQRRRRHRPQHRPVSGLASSTAGSVGGPPRWWWRLARSCSWPAGCRGRCCGGRGTWSLEAWRRPREQIQGGAAVARRHRSRTAADPGLDAGSFGSQALAACTRSRTGSRSGAGPGHPADPDPCPGTVSRAGLRGSVRAGRLGEVRGWAPSGVEAAKRAPKLPAKTAAVAAPDPGCAVNSGVEPARGQNPRPKIRWPKIRWPMWGRSPPPRPAAKIGRSDRVCPLRPHPPRRPRARHRPPCVRPPSSPRVSALVSSPGLFRRSRLGGHCASLIEMAGTSPAMTTVCASRPHFAHSPGVTLVAFATRAKQAFE